MHVLLYSDLNYRKERSMAAFFARPGTNEGAFATTPVTTTVAHRNKKEHVLAANAGKKKVPPN